MMSKLVGSYPHYVDGESWTQKDGLTVLGSVCCKPEWDGMGFESGSLQGLEAKRVGIGLSEEAFLG